MNERNYNVSGKERKALVNKVAELTGEKPVYLGMPTVAFKVGPFEISRNGILSWEDWAEESAERLIKDLEHAGFWSEGEEEPDVMELDEKSQENSSHVKSPDAKALPKFPEAAQDAPEGSEISNSNETPIGENSQEAADHLTISLPDKLSDSQYLLLMRLVEGKETLLKHAFQTDSLEVFRADGKISFPWFKIIDSDHTAAYTTFLTHLVKMAKNAKRIVVRDKPVDNEKFSFRVFMIRLGMIGDEYKAARKILMENLSGNSAWRNGVPTASTKMDPQPAVVKIIPAYDAETAANESEPTANNADPASENQEYSNTFEAPLTAENPINEDTNTEVAG